MFIILYDKKIISIVGKSIKDWIQQLFAALLELILCR